MAAAVQGQRPPDPSKLGVLQQLEEDRKERREETAALRLEVQALSNSVTAKERSSQEQVARGLTTLTNGLEVVEQGLQREVELRKEEIEQLSTKIRETLVKAAAKLRAEFTTLSTEIQKTSQDSGVNEEVMNEMLQLRQLTEMQQGIGREREIELTNRMDKLSQELASAPWNAESKAVRSVMESDLNRQETHSMGLMARIETLERLHAEQAFDAARWTQANEKTAEALQRQESASMTVAARIENLEQAMPNKMSRKSPIPGFDPNELATLTSRVMSMSSRLAQHEAVVEAVPARLAQHEAIVTSLPLRLNTIESAINECRQKTTDSTYKYETDSSNLNAKMHDLNEKYAESQQSANHLLEEEAKAFGVLDERLRNGSNQQAALQQDVANLSRSLEGSESKHAELLNEVFQVRSQLAQHGKKSGEVTGDALRQLQQQDKASAEAAARIEMLSDQAFDSSRKLEARLNIISGELATNANKVDALEAEARKGATGKADKVMVLELSRIVDGLRDQSNVVNEEISKFQVQMRNQAGSKKLQDDETAKLTNRLDKLHESLGRSELKSMELQNAHYNSNDSKVDKSEVLLLHADITSLRERFEGVHSQLSSLRENDEKLEQTTLKLQSIRDADSTQVKQALDKGMRQAIEETNFAAQQCQDKIKDLTTNSINKAEILKMSETIDALRDHYEALAPDVSAAKSLGSVQQKMQQVEATRLNSQLDKLRDECVSMSSQMSVINSNTEAASCREVELQNQVRRLENSLQSETSQKLAQQGESVQAHVDNLQSQLRTATQQTRVEVQKATKASEATASSTQQLVHELRTEILAVGSQTTEGKRQTQAELAEHAQLSAQFRHTIAAQKSQIVELQEEIRQGREWGNDVQNTMMQKLKAQDDAAQDRVEELQKELSMYGLRQNALRSEFSKKFEDTEADISKKLAQTDLAVERKLSETGTHAQRITKEVQGLRQFASVQEAKIDRVGEDIRDSEKVKLHSTLLSEECRELHNAIIANDSNLGTLNDRMVQWASSAMVDREHWNMFKNECTEDSNLTMSYGILARSEAQTCRDECVQMRQSLLRMESGEVGGFRALPQVQQPVPPTQQMENAIAQMQMQMQTQMQNANATLLARVTALERAEPKKLMERADSLEFVQDRQQEASNSQSLAQGQSVVSNPPQAAPPQSIPPQATPPQEYRQAGIASPSVSGSAPPQMSFTSSRVPQLSFASSRGPTSLSAVPSVGYGKGPDNPFNNSQSTKLFDRHNNGPQNTTSSPGTANLAASGTIPPSSFKGSAKKHPKAFQNIGKADEAEASFFDTLFDW